MRMRMRDIYFLELFGSAKLHAWPAYKQHKLIEWGDEGLHNILLLLIQIEWKIEMENDEKENNCCASIICITKKMNSSASL